MMRNMNKYYEDAGINTALLIQKDIIHEQANLYLQNSVADENHSGVRKPILNLAEVPPEHKLSNDLLYRNVPDEIRKNGRLLENEELFLLKLLDADGFISMPSRLTELILLMTRVHKMEHRILITYVLMYKTSKNCQEIFVLSGGFHLLKQWLKLADEQENISEIILLIELCKLLPFDVVCVKTSEIGKVIKKISKKYVQQSASKESSNGRSDSANRPEILQKVIRNIMEVWSTLHQKNVLIVLPTDSTNRNIPSLVVDINNRLINEKGKVIQEDTSVSTEVDNSRSRAIVKQSVVQNEDQTKLKVVEPEASLQNVHNEAAIVADSTQESDDSSNNEVKITTPIARKPGLIIVQGPVASVNIKEELASTPTNGLSALFPSIPILPAPTAFPSRTSFKAPTAIGERKSSSMADGARRLLQLRAQASASNSSSSETKDGADTSAESHKMGDGVLKSALKSNKKKKKLAIKWADEAGGSLREVQTFEVEKIKNKVASYKNHKELSKKERMLEKETHEHKIEDAMQKTAEWREPVPLQLSVAVKDYSQTPITSIEKQMQKARTAHIIEARYLDESLIPPNPDVIPGISDRIQLNEAIEIGSWYKKGSAEEAANFNSTAAVNGSNSLDFLPPIFKTLEPEILKIITENAQVVQSLMNPDGTINESKVEFVSSNLRNQLRMKTSAPPPPPPNPIFNNNLGNYPNQVVSNTVAAASYVSTGWDPMSNGMDNPALNNYTYNNAVAPVVKSASFFNDSNKVDIGTGKKGFQTPKNLHPCRFFNTAKGCQNGDKCGFGHFRPDALIAMSGSSIDGIGGLQMDTRGDGVGLKRSRPGTAPPPPRMQGPGARTMMGKNRQLSAVLSNPIEFDHISSTKRTRNN